MVLTLELLGYALTVGRPVTIDDAVGQPRTRLEPHIALVATFLADSDGRWIISQLM